MCTAPLKLGRFQLLYPLGSGAMGHVWAATHPGALPGQGIAVKVLQADRARTSSYRAAFLHEVHAIASLDHPHILAVLDHGRVSDEAAVSSGGKLVKGSPWLAMERADATLRSQPPSDWSSLRAVLMALLSALSHAHARSVLHRDIKPGNVLLGGWSSGVKLADFGLARPLRGGSSPTNRTAGTPGYMAPEQFEGRVARFGPWTDLYALGCLAWSLSCGRRPFTVQGDALRMAHLTWPVPPLQPSFPVPVGLEGWIRCLMSKEPAMRYPFAADAAAALAEMSPAMAPAAPMPSVLLGAEPTVTAPSSLDEPVSSVQPHSKMVFVGNGPMLSAACPQQPSRPRLLSGAGLALYGLRTLPVVGRSAEQQHLWDALLGVRRSRQPTAVVLEGPAGSGKSRLASWMAEVSHAEGAAWQVHAVHSPASGDAEGIQAAISQSLSLSGLSEARLQARLSRVLHSRGAVLEPASVAALSGLFTHRSDVEPAAERRTMADALLVRLLGALAGQRVLVLWLDDAIWSEDTLRCVGQLLQADVPVLSILTIRSEDRSLQPEANEQFRQLLSRERVVHHFLEPLSPTEQLDLVHRGLGLRGGLADLVCERAGGNPLFAELLVRDMVHRELLVPEADGFALRPGTTVALPDDLHATWLSRLDAACTDIRPLEIAALLGRVIDRGEWLKACSAAGLAPEDGLLDRLLRLQLVRASGIGTAWSFVHEMLRESLIRNARDSLRWASHHRACAEMLQSAGRPGRYGQHRLESGQPALALPALTAGLNARIAQGALAQAERLAADEKRALEQCAAEVGRLWVGHWLRSARIARERGRVAEAVLLCQQAITVAVEQEDRAAAAAEAALSAWRAGSHDEALRHAVQGAREAQSRSLAGQCIEVQAHVYSDQGALDKASDCYLQALDIYDDVGDDWGVAGCQLGLGVVAVARGDLDEAARWVRQGKQRAGVLGAQAREGVALNLLGEIARMRGEDAEAERLYQTARTLQETCGAIGGARIATLNLAMMALFRCDFETAHQPTAVVVSSMRREGAHQLLGAAHLILATCAAGEGRWEDWSMQSAAAEQILSDTGLVYPDLAEIATLAAELAEDAHEPEAARQAYTIALQQWKALDRKRKAAQIERRLRSI